MPQDSEFHQGTTIARLSQMRHRVLTNYQVRLGVPQMKTLQFILDGQVITSVLRVLQVSAGTVKSYQDTSVEVRMEDLIIKDVPRWLEKEYLENCLVIIGTPPATERAEVVWLDCRPLTHYDLVVRLQEQR
jgi:hypothetical protein